MISRTWLRIGERHRFTTCRRPMNDNPDVIFDDCGCPALEWI